MQQQKKKQQTRKSFQRDTGREASFKSGSRVPSIDVKGEIYSWLGSPSKILRLNNSIPGVVASEADGMFNAKELLSPEDRIIHILDNTFDFANSIAYAYASATEDNEDWEKVYKSKSKGFPETASFKWKYKDATKAAVVDAHTYCMNALVEIEEVLNKTDMPWEKNSPIPEGLNTDLLRVWKYLLRILIIAISNPCLKVKEPFSDILRPFLFFGWEWELVNTEVKIIFDAALPIHQSYVEAKSRMGV
eukprot:augustus_masked-scaffold_1-processed-gene-11.1-mRNA-1 protein AED:1.00 eAED:1.00 QI:0/-1/0/0/-1/1/1/0/246